VQFCALLFSFNHEAFQFKKQYIKIDKTDMTFLSAMNASFFIPTGEIARITRHQNR
jgi:hypothetical protein